MKNLLLIVTLAFSFNSLFAQAPSPETNSQFSLNLLMPSLEWEVKTGEKTTIDMLLGAGFGYHKSGAESKFGVLPAFQAGYRYYYNFDKRLAKGKKVSENSGNYIAAMGVIQSGNPIIGDYVLNYDYSGFIGPAWGLQRTYNSNFKLNLNLGAGYGFNDLGDSYFTPFVAIQLGWLVAK